MTFKFEPTLPRERPAEGVVFNPQPPATSFRAEPPIEPKAFDPYASRRNLMSSLGLYEYKSSDATRLGYERPHYALGFHSDTMRDFVNLFGLESDSCIAPIVRLRRQSSASTSEYNPTMTLIARCTFR